MNKACLRARGLEARRALTPDDVAAKSAAIRTRLKALPAFQRAPAYLCYVASKDNEVDTRPLIRELLEGAAPVLVPVARKGGMLIWSRLTALEELAPSRFGILEPAAPFLRPADPPPGGVAVVPGIVFTPDGWRIGYGGGYYDRFLAGFDGLAIALAFDVQLVETFVPQPHDRPVDYVVTESRVYERGRG